MHNLDVVHLTDKGRMVAEAMEDGEPGARTASDRILSYLEKEKDRNDVIEEILSNTLLSEKELSEALHRLSGGGYVVIEPAYVQPSLHGKHVSAEQEEQYHELRRKHGFEPY